MQSLFSVPCLDPWCHLLAETGSWFTLTFKNQNKLHFYLTVFFKMSIDKNTNFWKHLSHQQWTRFRESYLQVPKKISLLKLLLISRVKVHPRWNQNNRAHAVTACIGLWHHMLMHALHMLMHACTACTAPWRHRPMYAVTAWPLLFWFCLGYTFISSYFVLI